MTAGGSVGDLTRAISQQGYAVVSPALDEAVIDSLATALDQFGFESSVGRHAPMYALRNLLRAIPLVEQLASSLPVRRLMEPILGATAFPVQAIFFDKPLLANWKVPWHQDLTIPVRERIDTPGFGPWSVKGGVPHVQPPAAVLERMLIVRLHLDASTEENGPLRVIPGSHRHGRLTRAEIERSRTCGQESACLVPQGGALLMRPLLLHASSEARVPAHRRVIHLEYAAEPLPGGLRWVSQRDRRPCSPTYSRLKPSPRSCSGGSHVSRHEERLAELERDLRFHPASCDHPRRLTQDQIAAYNERGYLKGFRIFNEPEVLANRRSFDRLLEKATRDGGSSYSINGWHDRSRMIYDLATHPVILDYVEDLLGPNLVAWGTHYFCKLPGDGKAVSWHQDASYWPLTPARTVTVWLAIDDSDRENGCMRVIPGTHRLGQLEFRDSEATENNVLWQTVQRAEQYGEPVDFELKAGEISLHSDMLVHGSEPNRSQRRRCGLTVRYAATSVRAYWDWNLRSILCRGEDPGGHWGRLSRPEPGDQD